MGGKTVRYSEDKLAGFQINQATYGVVVPIVFGTARTSGNVIDYYDFAAIPHVDTQRTGKGGGKIKNTSYTYEAAVLLGLAEGPIDIGRIWTSEGETTLSALNLTLFRGEIGQAPWSYTQSKYPEKALPYSGLGYVAGVMNLGSSGGVPQLNFEVKGLLRDTGDGIDVNPADVIEYICTNQLNGVDFGVGGIDPESLERYRMYCKAADLYITLSLTETEKAYEIINKICKATNTIVFWSQNKLKLVPKCDERIEGNGVVYEPDTEPLYELTADDFLDDEPMVEFERAGNAEAYNHVPVKFINRENNYEEEVVDGEILTDINARGRRSMSEVDLSFIYTRDRAQFVANMLVRASLYARNKYKFKLGWSHCLLEPGDFITIYDPVISPNPIPVIIDTIEEDEDGELSVTAIGRKPGTYSGAKFATGTPSRYMIDRNVHPGNANPPVIFEAPKELTTANRPEIWIAASGSGKYWGGCSIWISDDNLSYKQIGKIYGPCRTGKLTSAMSSTDITLSVDLSESRGELNSGTAADAEYLNTLCWVDGEFLAYQNANLTGANKYNLTGLVRGAYGTAKSNHASGSRFVRIDDNIFKYPYRTEDIGKTIYIKLTSFNVWGLVEQSLDEVAEQVYVIEPGPPKQITNISITNFVKGFTINL